MKGQPLPGRGKASGATRQGVDLQAEEPLLLDPRTDDPAEHLALPDDGNVVGRGERGLATIETLGLNRTDLVRSGGKCSL